MIGSRTSKNKKDRFKERNKPTDRIVLGEDLGRVAGGRGPGKFEEVIGGEERSCFFFFFFFFLLVFVWESFFREKRKRRFVGENIKAQK